MSQDDLPPPFQGESPQQYHKRITAAFGHPVMASAELKPLSPKTPVKVTLWTAAGIIAAVFAAGWQAAVRLSAIEQMQRNFDARLEVVAKVVESTDPAHVKDECREIVRRELRGLTIECPRPTRRGEAVGNCKIVLPLSLRGDEP